MNKHLSHSHSTSRRLMLAVAAAAVATTSFSLTANAGAVFDDYHTATSPPPASGCGTTLSTGSSTLTVQSGGLARTVIVHVPTGYQASSQTPLIINLHGSGTTAALQEQFSGMDATADRDNFLVAYPQGLIPQEIGPLSGYDWNVPGDLLYGGAPVPANAPDDAAFVTALPQMLERDYCIDPSRVFLTGFSNGGRLTSYLACNASQTFAADAPIAGLRLYTPCPAGRPVPVISFQGTADPVDPIGGHTQQYWTYSVPQAAQYWAEQDHCRATPTTTTRTGYTSLIYSSCARHSSVQLYTIDGEGHEWPGGPPLPATLTGYLGPQSDAVDANTVMWAFFASHPLPNPGPRHDRTLCQGPK